MGERLERLAGEGSGAGGAYTTDGAGFPFPWKPGPDMTQLTHPKQRVAAPMNLEQFLAGAVACIGLALMTGVLYIWWGGRDQRRWEAELEGRELLVQEEKIEAQRLHEEATRLREEAAEFVRTGRQQLYRMAAECEPLDDEMADTQLSLEPVNADTVMR